MSGVVGAVGAAVSMVTLRAADVVLLPAASVALAVMLCVPSLNVLLVMLQLPLPSAVVVPSTVLPSSNTTALLASAVPEKVGVVTLLMLSVLELPLSLAAIRSGTETAGPVVSMVMLSPAEADETLPATSVALAVMLCVPSVRVLLASDALPLPAAALPTTIAPSKRVTVKPDVAATVNVGVVLLVMLSVLELPLSLVAVKSGAPGATGAVLS